MHYAKDIREIISSCVVAQRDEATGVKQLSALAAAGCVEDVIGPRKGFQSGLRPCPLSRATQRPPRGQSSQLAAMEVICLVVTAQQVSPGAGGAGRLGWGWEDGMRWASQNISPGKKRKQHRRLQYQECPPHTATHSLTAHTSQQPLFTPQFCPAAR